MLCPFFSSGRQTLYFTVPVDLAIFLKLNKNFLLTLWRSQLYFTVPEALAIFFFKWNKNFIFFSFGRRTYYLLGGGANST